MHRPARTFVLPEPLSRMLAAYAASPKNRRPKPKAPLTAGSKAAAIAYTLIETAKLIGVDPQAWLADTFARSPDYKITKVDDLLPWHWKG